MDKSDIENKKIFICNINELQKYKNKTGTYKATVKMDIYKYKVSSTLPLSRGSRDKFGPEQVMIFDILYHDNGISVVVGEKKAKLLFDRQPEKTYSYSDMFDSLQKSIYLIENTKRGEAFISEKSDLSFDIDEILNASSRLFSKIRSFDFLYINEHDQNLPVINEDWVKDARLVRVDAVKIGSVTKEVVIPNFTLPEKSEDTDPNCTSEED